MLRKGVKWFCALFILPLALAAQEPDINKEKQPNLFSISLGLQHGFIFAHSPLVENTKGANPTGIEIGFNWQRNDAASWDLCNCYPRKGLLLSYYDYDTEILGKSIGASYFLEPNYKIGRRKFFFLKGSAGLAYLTNPFDSVKNPGNQSYSAHLSMHIALGLGISFQLNDHWLINGSANYQHISNGGLSQPNKGINWPTAGISVLYQKQSREYYSGVRSKEKFWKGQPVLWDVAVFGMGKKGTDESGERKRRALIGLNVQGSKQVGRINMLSGGVEYFYDRSLKLRLKRDSIDASASRAGITFGHEFILGNFLFSQRIGMYVFDQSPYYDRLYHRWGIHFMINENWGLGFNLLAHRHVADFIDFRMGYRL